MLSRADSRSHVAWSSGMPGSRRPAHRVREDEFGLEQRPVVASLMVVKRRALGFCVVCAKAGKSPLITRSAPFREFLALSSHNPGSSICRISRSLNWSLSVMPSLCSSCAVLLKSVLKSGRFAGPGVRQVSDGSRTTNAFQISVMDPHAQTLHGRFPNACERTATNTNLRLVLAALPAIGAHLRAIEPFIRLILTSLPVPEWPIG